MYEMSQRHSVWVAKNHVNPCNSAPPLRPASVYPPPLVREDTRGRGGWGVNILEDVRHSSVLYVCKYFVDITKLDQI